MTRYRKGVREMYQSDRAVGMSHWAAVRFIEDLDLWDEVVDLVVDAQGIVVKVIH